MVVSTQLKHIDQIGNLPQVGVKIENILNCHLVSRIQRCRCVFFGNPGWSTRKKKEKLDGMFGSNHVRFQGRHGFSGSISGFWAKIGDAAKTSENPPVSSHV